MNTGTQFFMFCRFYVGKWWINKYITIPVNGSMQNPTFVADDYVKNTQIIAYLWHLYLSDPHVSKDVKRGSTRARGKQKMLNTFKTIYENADIAREFAQSREA